MSWYFWSLFNTNAADTNSFGEASQDDEYHDFTDNHTTQPVPASEFIKIRAMNFSRLS